MSIEQALAENTAAVNALAAAMAKFNLGVVPSPVAPVTKANGADKKLPPAAPAADAKKDGEELGSVAPSFDEVKKEFLALSVKPGGRERVKAVLATFGVELLSKAKPEQYQAIFDALKKAATQ